MTMYKYKELFNRDVQSLIIKNQTFVNVCKGNQHVLLMYNELIIIKSALNVS